MFLCAGCYAPAFAQVLSFKEVPSLDSVAVLTGAEQTDLYLPLIKGKKIAIVCNQTSMVGKTHLVDTLRKLGGNIKVIFGPEHGFRGEADAGEYVNTSVDAQTGIPVVSLYGKNKKPSADQLAEVELLLFDIQDVGCRFYTYISTLSYVMEACAALQIPMLILDRPNPNGHFVDGPVLESGFASFVGLHPVPVVHGCTIAEYANMVKGEKWIANAGDLELIVIPSKGWTHRKLYSLPIKPSPNLPNMKAVWLYPSLCFFEGTAVSIGRGTDKPFQCIGFPQLKDGNYAFTPTSKPGAKNPPYRDTLCHGFLLEDFAENYLRDSGELYMYWLLEAYNAFPVKSRFFNAFFDKLAGTDKLRKQVISGVSEKDIRDSWQAGIRNYKQIRKKYLLYDDFE